MITFYALLAICAGNSPTTGEFPSQRSVTRSCDVFLHLRLNKRWSKQSWGWWFETPPCSFWRPCNDVILPRVIHRPSHRQCWEGRKEDNSEMTWNVLDGNEPEEVSWSKSYFETEYLCGSPYLTILIIILWLFDEVTSSLMVKVW